MAGDYMILRKGPCWACDMRRWDRLRCSHGDWPGLCDHASCPNHEPSSLDIAIKDAGFCGRPGPEEADLLRASEDRLCRMLENRMRRHDALA